MRRALSITLVFVTGVWLAHCGDGTTAPAHGPPAQISVVSGDGQQAEVGQALPLPVVVLVRDAAGRAVPGATVSWLPLVGGGTVSSATSTTDDVGHAPANWTLGNTVGAEAQTLRATVGGALGPSVDVTASGLLAAGQLSVASGDGQVGAASAPLGKPIQALVRTPGGAAVRGVSVDWRVTSGGGSLSAASSLTDFQGIARVTWTLGAAEGAQSAEASATGLTPGSVTFTARALVPAPGTITGAITTTSAFLAPPSRPGLSSALSYPRGLSGSGRADAAVRLPAFTPLRSRGLEYRTNDLVVTFRATPLAAPPKGSPAMASPATARAVGTAVRKELEPWASTGRVTVTGVSPVVLAARLRVRDPEDLDSVAAALQRDPAVAGVSRDWWVRPDGRPAPAQGPSGTIPNDPNYPNQSWHYTMIDLPRAWSITTGSARVLVAVVDNGIRFDHPAIAANLTGDGYDFVATGLSDSVCAGGSIDNSGDGDGYDPDPTIPDDWDLDAAGTCLDTRSPVGGHGLHVAGTIGAVGNDGIGVTGVNWAVRIRPVRVLGLDGGSFFDIAQGVLYAAGLPADNGREGTVQAPSAARIINMSLGGGCPATGFPDVVHDAIIAATNAGALVVASAGNNASSAPSCPAAYPEVLSVTAVGPDGLRASYANFGSTVDIAAPGGDFDGGTDGTFGIFSTTCDFTTRPCTPNQARYFGTSQAAPHVSGVAALLLAVAPGLTAADLRSRLTTYAADAGVPGRDDQYGAGIVNARNSLTQTLTPPAQPYVRVYDATTVQAVATQPVGPDGVFTASGLAAGTYYVFAGEDENGDAQLGVPGRRWGALGGTATPQGVAVTASAGGSAFFSLGFANEVEPNGLSTTNNRLIVGGHLHGALASPGDSDVVRVDVPAGGQYTFATSGWQGAFCRFALNVNTVLVLYDVNKVELARNDDADAAGNNFCSVISTTLAAGTYYLGVYGGLDFGGAPQRGRYRVEARAGS